jgi:hypothetical protein
LTVIDGKEGKGDTGKEFSYYSGSLVSFSVEKTVTRYGSIFC